jgi:hypothetical protein
VPEPAFGACRFRSRRSTRDTQAPLRQAGPRGHELWELEQPRARRNQQADRQLYRRDGSDESKPNEMTAFEPRPFLWNWELPRLT